jgi:hypothetical protein
MQNLKTKKGYKNNLESKAIREGWMQVPIPQLKSTTIEFASE